MDTKTKTIKYENTELRKNLRELRIRTSLTQKDLAHKLGISVPGYSKIETGDTDVNLSRLCQIANVYELPLADLFINEADQKQYPESNLSYLNMLKHKLVQKEMEVSELQKKVIGLYEKLESVSVNGNVMVV